MGDGVWRDPAYIKNYMRRYNQKHRLRINAKKAEWRRNNKDSVNRTARKRRAAGHGLGRRQDAYREFIQENGECLSCGAIERLEIDHVNPLSRGGRDYPDNWQVLCRGCNAKKSGAIVDYRLMLAVHGIEVEEI